MMGCWTKNNRRMVGKSRRSIIASSLLPLALFILSWNYNVASSFILVSRRPPTQEGVRSAAMTTARYFDPSPFRRVIMQIPRYLAAAREDDEEDQKVDDDELEDEDSSSDDDDDDTGNSSKPLLTDERKANLFQFLLRDLQVEGVPLLGIDADQVQTLQAAIWTTMAGLLASAVGGEEEESSSSALLSPSNNGDEPNKQKSEEPTTSPTTTTTEPPPPQSSSVSKVCLVFEDIPVEALTAFVQDFQTLQNDVLMRQSLPELLAFRLALVGNGIGPAITISVQLDENAANAFHNHTDPLTIIDKTYAGDGVLRAIEAFVKRVVMDNTDDAIGMQLPVYRYCGFADACHALSAFWNCLCELQAKPELPSIILAFPMDFNPALADLMNRSLRLYRGHDVLSLVHYGPSYDRAMVEPHDGPALGHLPPLAWLDPIMAQYAKPEGEVDEDASLELGRVANFQRRAPVAAVLIKRVELMNQEVKGNPLAASSDLMLADGVTNVAAFGLPLFAQGVQRLAKIGADQLEASLDQEIAMIME
jgi:hypothetical protein